MDWNFRGLNPSFKEFMEKNPDKTLLGVFWAMYWRLGILIVAIELTFIGAVLISSAVFGFSLHK